MGPLSKTIVVVGGNGFLGSAICRRAVAHGNFQVISISSSGKPYTTPKGHSPAWVNKVEWHKASAFDPPSYAPLLNKKHAVIHTLGVLLEGGYKDAVKEGSLTKIAGAFSRGWGLGDQGNPLKKRAGPGEYEIMNRDSAIKVLDTYLEAEPPSDSDSASRAFVYISAEDIFRPFVPKRYIDTKREAEHGIATLCNNNETANIRDVSIRPGLMYHPHIRPFTTPLATLVDFSSKIHYSPPFNLPLPLPADILRSLGTRSEPGRPQSTGATDSPDVSPLQVPSSSLPSLANLLETPPIHVDHVADAIIRAIEDPTVKGPVGVEKMRELIGWSRRVDNVREAQTLQD
ncbi:hypothetical protein FRC02_006947 [Tulasnella sp. 418]|nr:hypothetical protein FRC02_006947 [Tulasnella sp. 418]